MSKAILTEDVLQDKIDNFLARKNQQMHIREEKLKSSRLTTFRGYTMKLSL